VIRILSVFGLAALVFREFFPEREAAQFTSRVDEWWFEELV